MIAALTGWLRRPHTCTPLTDAISGDVRCWCGARPEFETTLRRALHAEGQRISTNGAPGWNPGAPPQSPTDCLESKAMHTLLSEGTPRGRQMAAALALAHLLETGPDELAEWRIDEAGALHGHVRRPHSDAQARAAVHEFAGFLGHRGAERSQGRNDRTEWVHLSTSGTYRGVAVNVWTHVGIRSTSPYASFGGTR